MYEVCYFIHSVKTTTRSSVDASSILQIPVHHYSNEVGTSGPFRSFATLHPTEISLPTTPKADT